MLMSQNLIAYTKEIKQLIHTTHLKFIAAYLVSLYEISVQGLQWLSANIGISRSTRFYANFTIEEMGSEAGPVLKCVNLSSKFINRVET